jgi:16S rRNA (guanine527-N7)-methyltransferase
MFHVKHNSKPDSLYKDFLRKKFTITVEQLDKIDQYCAEIKEWSRRQNIVSRNDIDYLFARHVMPSAFITGIIMNESAKMVADLGSGSGFPGIIIKILLPKNDVHLIDSSRKKCLFLLELCERIDIPCKVINTRIENLSQNVLFNFDVIVSRAVAPLASLWAWSEKSLVPKGALFVLKGGEIDMELQLIEKMNLDIDIFRPDDEWRNSGEMDKKKFVVRMRRHYSNG